MSPSTKKAGKAAKKSDVRSDTGSIRFPWAKFALGYVFYVFFHEINRLLPGTILATIFGEGFESIYAHMKMLFYAYLILSIIDTIRNNKTGLSGSFFYARMLILSSVPWMMVIVYYALEAVGIFLPRSIDLPWALLVTGFGLFLSLQLEQPLEKAEFQPATKAAIAVAFLAAVITYVGFSFAIPDNFFIAIE
jgi:hypothetical protein